MDEPRPIIFDLGSQLVKLGFGGDNKPNAECLSLVGHPRYIYPGILVGMGQRDCYVGVEALSKCGVLVIEYPIHRGLIADWHFIQKIWHHSFYFELRCDPEEHPLMILEHPLTPKNTREKTAQIMFEHFNVPALFFANPCVASIRAVGRTTGVALCMGGQTTYCMVVKDGKGLINTLNTLDIGAQDLSTSLVKYIETKYPGSFSTSAEQEIVADMREKIGYIALDYDAEMQKPENEVAASYEDPSGTVWQFHHELFTQNEILFKPEMYGIEKDGIHHMIYSSIKKCDASIQSELFNNIVLSGGNSLTRGLDARLIKELKVLAPEYSDHIRIESGPHPNLRRDLSFTGASMLSTTLNLADWITKAEYNESGPSIIQSKCPIGLL